MDPVDRTTEVMERVAETDRRAGVKRLPDVYHGVILGRRCEDCSHSIKAERLALIPDARRCTSCQGEHEERERRHA